MNTSHQTETTLVIGAAGKTGRRLVPHLTERGHSVRAASRQPGHGGVVFDWYRPETHTAALAGVDAVYLVAPEFVEDPTEAIEPFLKAASRAGVRRVVALSSLGAEFSAEPADSGRRRMEEHLKATQMAWTILRPTGFNQNFSEGFLLPGIVHFDTVMTASEDGAVAFIDAGDIAAVAAVCLTSETHAGAEYALTGPEEITFDAAVRAISAAAGRTISHRAAAPAEMQQTLERAGVPADYVQMLLRDMEGTRNGESARVTDTVQRVTGRPARSFGDYVAEAAGAWQAAAVGR